MKPISEMTPEELRLELARLHAGIYIEEAETGAFLVIHSGKVAQRYVKRKWAEKFVMSITPDWPNDTDTALDLFREKKLDHTNEYDTYNDLYNVWSHRLGFRTFKRISHWHKSLAMALCMVYCEHARG